MAWIQGAMTITLIVTGGAMMIQQDPAPTPPAAQPAVKPPDRTILWSVDLKSTSYGSAAAGDLNGDGKPDLVFGTYFNDEHAYAINGADGKVMWTMKSRGGPMDASVLIVDLDKNNRPEVVFADSAHGTVFCLDSAGKTVWTYDGPNATDSPPAAADLDGDGKIEIVYGTWKGQQTPGNVVCLDGGTGKMQWTAKVPGHIQSEPALVDVDGDKVLDVLVTNWMGDNRLRALSGKDGRELWAFDTGDWIYHGASVFDFDKDGKPEIVVADRRGSVWLLSAAKGEKIWETRLEGESEGMVFAPTTLVDADNDGTPEIVVCGVNVHMLDARGRLRWKRPGSHYKSISRGVAAADIDGDGTIELVYGHGTTVYVISADKGEERWSFDLKIGKDPHEDIDHAPLLVNLDGDGRLDIFIVVGRGLSGQDEQTHMKGNYGRAYALRVPPWTTAKSATSVEGKPEAVASQREWTTFRGNNRRTGYRTP